MTSTSEEAQRVAASLRQRGIEDGPIAWALVCGSGIGSTLMEEGNDALGLEIEHSVSLAELGLPAPEVAGHGQALVFGRLGSARIAVQTGRLHPYEGHPMSVVCAPLGAMLELGAQRVALTCAVGGINPDLQAGALVSLRDQINLFGPTPLRGAEFIDCSQLYHPELRARLQAIVASRGEELPEVVYAHARGPQYETPAEVAALSRLGGDVVGMSTTYEAILAAAVGAKSCGIGVVTNVAGAQGLSHTEVQERSAQARGRLAALLRELMGS